MGADQVAKLQREKATEVIDARERAALGQQASGRAAVGVGRRWQRPQRRAIAVAVERVVAAVERTEADDVADLAEGLERT